MEATVTITGKHGHLVRGRLGCQTSCCRTVERLATVLALASAPSRPASCGAVWLRHDAAV